MKPSPKLFLRMIPAIVFTLAVVLPVSSQTEREREREANDRDLDRRSWNLKLLSLSAAKTKNKRPRPEQAVEQLQEDFTRLQIVNRTLGRSVIGNRTLDLKFVSKSVSEIKKRAVRLNANLALPDPETPSALPSMESLTRQAQLKSSLLRLVELVFSFVDNPFFTEASVVDTQQTSKARRDLEDIIELSKRLKQEVEKLDKATSKESHRFRYMSLEPISLRAPNRGKGALVVSGILESPRRGRPYSGFEKVLTRHTKGITIRPHI